MKRKPDPEDAPATARDWAEILHARVIRDARRMWSSGELLAQGVTRRQFEAGVRALERDFVQQWGPR